ncbi:2-oxoacid:acceptor oxidoreductase subunit alpha [Natronoflexus pectinivorans]|uniref:2-oxoglutarate ferredoxin oxidoreductase subunit alpha n=1 Tax=Natronoflexus pectinivorans TaxID=682526 RepID=A0A4R2GMG9_9BACT|nr:2-oxoacid:acceptor oxidoreductase subunit alpha [Natronoflexus pectinivorans]TCO10413.1 2-oxoglutarate ferredoxin oxidoreductase subunit alpha [Natronoflexus pectinivorans]
MQRRSKIIDANRIAVRFSGDSGDGMQLTGSLFSLTTAAFGNDISTFPDFPADIRAPQGTISGVSGFQVHFGKGVCTPADLTDVLVAMNPAALKSNVSFMSPGGTIIMDVDNFDKKNLVKAGYETDDPIIEDKLQGFNIVKAPITSLSQECTKDLKLDRKSILRSKNMFALGLINWMFNRPIDYTRKYIRHKFSHKPEVMEANLRILETGFNYGNIIQAGTPSFHITTTEPQKGLYRNLSGNKAVAWGFLLAAEKSGLQLFLGSYPITPATEILQELAGRKDLGVKVFQAEDEIAAIASAIGASYAGALGITNTSGPGLSLKSEALGLAVMAEVPLVVVNVQRGGPSTGLPTKTEQSDLMQALYGRNGESPLVVMAASTPVNCFDYAFYASKIALEHMIPVILLTDSFLANGSQQWKVPEEGDFPNIEIPVSRQKPGEFSPYLRNSEKLNRDWVCPGMEGFEHRIGSLEKDAETGAVSHDGPNHEIMVHLREEKLKRVANFIPPLTVEGKTEAEVLVVGWGSTYGHLHTAIEELTNEGHQIAFAQFNYINPLPKNTGEILSKYKTIIVCELNLGQFAAWLRNHFPQHRYIQYNKVQGLPFTIKELKEFFRKNLEELK